MRHDLRPFAAVFLLAAACQSDSGVKVYNTPPAVELTAPADGQAFHEADQVTFTALVEDEQTDNATLTYAWASTLQGTLAGEQTVSEIGVILAADPLEPGEHTVILKVIDEGGASDEARVDLSVAENTDPVVAFVEPEAGGTVALGASAHVEIAVSDDYESDLTVLGLQWSGIEDLSGAPSTPNADGSADFYLEGLALGTYTLDVLAIDPLGGSGRASVSFEVVEPDADEDGYNDATLGGDDCNDGDAAINPGAYERCDGVDNDCDGTTDEGDALDADGYYADADADGFGDPYASLEACEAPAGFVTNDDDCDDDAASVNPDAPETCNGVDDDCDGTADDNATDPTTWYVDDDGDGYGSDDTTRIACDAPGGYVDNGDDCNDGNASISPGVTETCNGRDDNCDGATDEDTASDAATWYLDVDADGYGDATLTDVDCEQPSGYVANDDDCDDSDPGVSPADTETCDGQDDDCDGTVDNDASDASTWYADADGDGYGDASASQRACSQPADYVANDDDCDDTDAAVLDPGSFTWYRDADGDSYGKASSTTTGCTVPSGYVADDTDCDDTDAAVYPGASDTWYDGEDADCAGDDDYDQDGDGYASADYTGEDCDDTDASRYPGSATWTVPGDFATIQEAIDAACTQDSIEVSAGTYVENLDYGDKAVVLVGVDGAEYTTIDGDFNGDPTVTMSGGTLEGFTVTNGLANNGGGIYLFDADSAELVDLLVTENWATTYGGGAYVSSSGDVVVSGCTFSGNQAGNYGGGMAFSGYRSGTSSALAMSDTAFEGNTLTSSGYGGGLYYYSWGSATYAGTFSDVDFESNYASSGYGGGAYLSGYFTWSGGEISGNRASYDGGLYAQGYLSLSDLTVDGNYASYYGGLSVYGYGSSSTVEDVRLSGNYSSYYLSSFEGTLTVADVDIEGNYASYYLLYGSGTQTWSGVSVRRNVASSNYVAYLSGTWTLADVDIRDNTMTSTSDSYFAVYAYGTGSLDGVVIAGNRGMTGLYLYPSSTSSDISVVNTTIVGNDGHGLYVYPTWVNQVDLRNVVIAHNGGYGIYDTHSTFDPVLEYDDVYDNVDGDYTGVADPTGTDGNLSVDPEFVFLDLGSDPAYWDLHLDGSSPLVDAGDPSITDGDGSTSDIGAYGGASADYDWYDDDDGDGLYDGWEEAHGLDTTRDDSADDGDGDGLDNAEELAYGTDPGDDDTDGDRAPDGDEVTAGTDPLVPDHAWDLEVYGSSSSYYYLGYAVDFPGDTDGDGDEDLLAMSYVYGFVVAGDATGTAAIDASYLARITEGSGYASTMTGAGDLDGDGMADLAWANPYSSGGTVRLLYSPYASSETGHDASWTGEASDDYAGIRLAAVGDVDADGYDDLLVGAYGEDTSGSYAGAAYLVSGPGDGGGGLSRAAAKLTGESAGSYAGIGVAGPGDVTGDGTPDLLIGAHGESSVATSSGAVYLVAGPVGGSLGLDDADAKLTGEGTYHYAGYQRAGSGDFDGDGNRDLLVGAFGYRGYTGAAYVVSGPPSSGELGDIAAGTWSGDGAYDYVGLYIDGAGDVDGDGNDDFVVGSPYQEGYTGAAYVVLGPATGSHTMADADLRVVGEATGDYLGYSVAGGGDVDGDGLGDVLVGAPYADDNGSSSGTVRLLLGASF